MSSMQAALESTSYREVAGQFGETLFLPDSDPALKRRITRLITSTPQHVMVSTSANLQRATSELPAGELPVPALYVLASNADPSLAADLKARYPDLATAQVVGAGQLPQLEVADQFNAMLRRFIETLP